MNNGFSAESSQTTDANRQLAGLMVDAQMISSDMMEIALQISAGFGETLGEVLVDTNKLSDVDVQNALLAQSMIDKGLVDSGVAVRALHFSYRTRLAFAEAIGRAGAMFQANDKMVGAH